jgi:nucleoside-diphosphate-sugar epimerase
MEMPGEMGVETSLMRGQIVLNGITDLQARSRRTNCHPTVLLTGASGVVGRALLARLRGWRVVCLVHHTPVNIPGVHSVPGDVSKPGLGVDASGYADLAGQVDAVIHCAAITQFNRSDGSLEATNIGGTENVLAFAEDAAAIFYHVSTAFVNTEAVSDNQQTALGYASSKRAAEMVVKSSSVPHVILRPSVVIGDSDTGRIQSFQGLHQVAAAISAGLLPVIPFDPAWPIDFVPCDVVADAIATVVDHRLTGVELWITAGSKALRLDQAVSTCVALVNELGMPVEQPRFVPPDLFERLIAPVFLAEMPTRIRIAVKRTLDFFSTYLAAGRTMPSSLAELESIGMRPLPDQHDTLETSLRYWAQESNLIRSSAIREVA